MEEVKNVPNVKKVIVELDNGKTLEFDKQFVLYAQDEMSETEKRLSEDNESKICGVISCRHSFMASVACSMLETLNSKADGLDRKVIMKHLIDTDDTAKLLATIFG